MTLLYDSDNPASIPSGVWAAGYVDGYAASAWNSPSGWARFPGAKRIAVFASTDDGDVLDVEQQDATPAQVPAWIRMRRNSGVAMPWVYCNRSNRSAVEQALASASLVASEVSLWVATLDGTQSVPAGPYPVAAVQYQAARPGQHYDISIVGAVFGPGGGTIGGGETLTPGMKIGLAKVAFCSIYNRQPTPQEQTDFANTLLEDGSNYNTLCDGLSSLAETAADLVPLQAPVLRTDLDRVAASVPQVNAVPHHHAGGATGPMVPD